MKLTASANGDMTFDQIIRSEKFLNLNKYFSKIDLKDELASLWEKGLGILKQRFPNTPVLALTATATASVKEDVVQALGLINCIVFRQSFNRTNLRYIPDNFFSSF